MHEMVDLIAAAGQEEQEVQVRKERALQARVKWKEGREKRELVRSLLIDIISESVNSSVKCFDMKPVKLEIDRIKRVLRGEMLREDLLAREKVREERKEKMRGERVLERKGSVKT